MCWALIGVPKTSRDMKKDCDKPGCPTDHRCQVLARGDEIRLWHEPDQRRCPLYFRFWGTEWSISAAIDPGCVKTQKSKRDEE
jgi:hypothetical protein